MPLLDREPDRFPPDLFGTTAPDGDGGLWWVLHTRPRQEKAVARYLHAARVPFYLPLIERRLRVLGRPVSSHVPLFGGYVFLRATPEQRLAALPPRRLVGTLRVPDQRGLWEDLRQVHRLIESRAPILP